MNEKIQKSKAAINMWNINTLLAIIVFFFHEYHPDDSRKRLKHVAGLPHVGALLYPITQQLLEFIRYFSLLKGTWITTNSLISSGYNSAYKRHVVDVVQAKLAAKGPEGCSKLFVKVCKVLANKYCNSGKERNDILDDKQLIINGYPHDLHMPLFS
jgi:hypothetical protein